MAPSAPPGSATGHRDPPVRSRAGGTHLTGMHAFSLVVIQYGLAFWSAVHLVIQLHWIVTAFN